MHMGADPEPASMAVFSEKPYLVVNTAMKPTYFSNPEIFRQDGEGLRRFVFAGPLQRFGTGVETTDLLVTEFARMWAAVDIPRWRSPASPGENPGGEVPTWLR